MTANTIDAADKQFDHASIVKRANIYFDGKCVSHTVVLNDGTRKTLGVIFPASLTFSTQAAEQIDVNAGRCRVRNPGEAQWREYGPGESISVPANTTFDIEVTETLDYVCHYL
jgi:uncharacterized protein YaiE (UPF0345 family)